MLSYSKLGKHNDRMGNQLFEYAFLRTQSERLGVDFYCPKWIGDDIFHLNDAKMRTSDSIGIINYYSEAFPIRDYDRKSLKIMDNTEVFGYFESEKNFDTNNARKWYSFKKEKIASVKEKYKEIDFSNSVGIHLRLGDKQDDSYMNKIFFVPRFFYYKNSLKLIQNKSSCLEPKTILIFSDEPKKAKKYFHKLEGDIIYIQENKDWEDLYLMTQCHDFICGSSTMSWWGAWLISQEDKKIIFPREGTFRVGGPHKNLDLIPDEWIKIRALWPILDNFFLDYNDIYAKIGLFLKNNIPVLHRLLKHYFFDQK